MTMRLFSFRLNIAFLPQSSPVKKLWHRRPFSDGYDNTSGCTAEACSLRDGYEALCARGFVVIGISKDSPKSHLKFAEKYTLPFILLSDESTEVNQAFGVWQKKKMAGREYMGTVRTTFITDATHHITHIITKVDTKNAAAQIESLLDS